MWKTDGTHNSKTYTVHTSVNSKNIRFTLLWRTDGTHNSKTIRFILLWTVKIHGSHCCEEQTERTTVKLFGSYYFEQQMERTTVKIYGSYYFEQQMERTHNSKIIRFMLLWTTNGSHNSRNIGLYHCEQQSKYRCILLWTTNRIENKTIHFPHWKQLLKLDIAK